MSRAVFKFRVEDESMYECDFCRSPVPLFMFELRPGLKKWLCQLCANSVYPGSMLSYPSRDDNAELFGTVFYVGNAILKELGKFATAETVEAKTDG